MAVRSRGTSRRSLDLPRADLEHLLNVCQQSQIEPYPPEHFADSRKPGKMKERWHDCLDGCVMLTGCRHFHRGEPRNRPREKQDRDDGDSAPR